MNILQNKLNPTDCYMTNVLLTVAGEGAQLTAEARLWERINVFYAIYVV